MFRLPCECISYEISCTNLLSQQRGTINLQQVLLKYRASLKLSVQVKGKELSLHHARLPCLKVDGMAMLVLL